MQQKPWSHRPHGRSIFGFKLLHSIILRIATNHSASLLVPESANRISTGPLVETPSWIRSASTLIEAACTMYPLRTQTQTPQSKSSIEPERGPDPEPV